MAAKYAWLATVISKESNEMILIRNFVTAKPFFRSFSGANAKQLRHYIIPTLIDDKPDAITIHVGTNEMIS